MNTHLPKVVENRKKRLGRGYGSGKGGHTTGRGEKGQKARTHIPEIFEGMKVKKSLLKRLPLRRGKGKFSAGKKPVPVNIDVLNKLSDGSKVNIDTLVKNGVVDERIAKEYGVKILGNGELKKKLIIELPISKSALKKVEKAGGKVAEKTSEKEIKAAK